MNGINFGQYIPRDSWVHNLDPRAKLYLVVVLMATVIGVSGLPGILTTLAYAAWLMMLAKVPFRTYWQNTRTLLIIVAITVIFQILLVPGEVVFRWWIVSVTDYGLRLGALMTYRLLMIYLLAQLLTLTTSPLQMTDALERILKPFSRVGIQAHELAMIMTIALRFIPVFFEETDKIVKAQVSRGADFQSGWVKSARNLVSIIVPLFNRALRRADELALAMEARCYAGGEGRTRLHTMKMKSADYTVIGLTTALAVAVFLFRL